MVGVGLWLGARGGGFPPRSGNCHLHLGCTFLDGGVKAEKDWLKPLLAPSIDDAAKRLRVSEDMNALFRAQAKGCGEGWDLYGHGEGAKNMRPFLERNFSEHLFMKIERFDKGVRMWGSTKVHFKIVNSNLLRRSSTVIIYFAWRRLRPPGLAGLRLCQEL